jgi:hypothetical protein
MASPNLNEGVVTVIDLETYETIKEIKTLGPGFFLRSHENSRYAFTDSMMSKENKNVLQVIDKQSLEVVAQIKANPGQTLAHVEFTRDGRYALASLWEDGWRAGGDRRADARGSEAHPGQETGRQVQRLE